MTFLENKIPPPVVGLLFCVIIWAISTLTYVLPVSIISQPRGLVIAVILLILGFSFAISGGISFRMAKTTVNPLKPEMASALVTSGVFKYSRNPMYVGLAIILLAWTMYLAAPFGLIGVLGFMAYIQRFQIVPEERAMHKLFGDEFEAYQSIVRRWL
ncbi:MAG: isoprenylcysteine carboxylmethyltransferase family protein [Porticoccaceae bacterium]|nr:isoprenylcysteine carboxylmethyltransferase family protein [Porticoccaceae bacterium]